MANIKLTAAPLSGGGDIDIAGNRIIIRDDLALVSVATPLGGEDALKKTLTAEFGLKVPAATLSSTAKGMRAVSMAPDAMLLIFAHATPDAEMHVRAKLGGAGYTTDQTDSMLAIEVSGPATMAAMERICPLDLQHGSFGKNASGRTVMEHMAATIIALGDAHFLLLTASSSAKSFLHALEKSYRNVIS